jgi:hypothetical protein
MKRTYCPSLLQTLESQIITRLKQGKWKLSSLVWFAVDRLHQFQLLTHDNVFRSELLRQYHVSDHA